MMQTMKNRSRAGCRDCGYGCCRDYVPNKVIRKRESHIWKKDQNDY